LNKASFNSQFSFFFSDYLTNKQMQYMWNSFFSSFFKANIGIEQDSVLSPILSVIYIAPIFHFCESNTNIFCGYNIILSLFTQFGLIKYDKSDFSIF